MTEATNTPAVVDPTPVAPVTPSVATADLGVEKVAPKASPTTAADATAGADVDENGAKDLTEDEVIEEQFPSLIGEPELEIAKRSNDAENDDERDTFRKVFVLLKADYEGGDKSGIHEANEAAVRQFLINQGLRPLGPITHRAEKHPDGHSINLVYLAKAVPAATTTDFEVAHARVDGTEVQANDVATEAQRLPGDVATEDEDPGTPE